MGGTPIAGWFVAENPMKTDDENPTRPVSRVHLAALGTWAVHVPMGSMYAMVTFAIKKKSQFWIRINLPLATGSVMG